MQPLLGSEIVLDSATQASPAGSLRLPSGGSLGYYTVKPLSGFP